VTGLVRKLDPIVSSQIAAGEVVERPASVVKELVENSIDAGAKRILVEIQGAGLRLIRVSDNGTGMSKDDALAALERFATSKLKSVEDLRRIQTLGFRGEALPSIASCSRLWLETRTEDVAAGVQIKVEAGKILHVIEKGLPRGTTVTVRDLFFNTPARLEFIKSKSREREAIIDVVQRLALAWSSISFILKSENRIILRTNGKNLSSALADIFGPETASSMIPVSAQDASSESLAQATGKNCGTEGVKITGFIGLPRLYRRHRDRQIFSVNSRPVRNQMLGWCVDSAFSGLLPPKTHCVCVLNIAVPANEIDVNVHPTKADVKFKDEKKIKSLLIQKVHEALRSAGFNEPRAADMQKEWVISPILADASSGVVRDSRKGKSFAHLLVNDDDAASTEKDKVTELPLGWKYMGSLSETYLVVKTPESLMIIDKHALAESLAYQALLQRRSGSQELLVPEILRLDPIEANLYEEYQKELNDTGFDSRLIGQRTVLVTKVPLILGKPLLPGSLKEVLAKLKEDTNNNVSAERHLLKICIATAACHASVRAGEPLSEEEATNLISQFCRNPDARTCPHGRPTVKEIPLGELDKFFGR